LITQSFLFHPVRLSLPATTRANTTHARATYTYTTLLDHVGFTQLRFKNFITSPPPALNKFYWGNGRFRLPECIAVLRIQISRVAGPGNQKLKFFKGRVATLVVKNQNISGHVTHRLYGPTLGSPERFSPVWPEACNHLNFLNFYVPCTSNIITSYLLDHQELLKGGLIPLTPKKTPETSPTCRNPGQNPPTHFGAKPNKD
jgi:hypothetical protein